MLGAHVRSFGHAGPASGATATTGPSFGMEFGVMTGTSFAVWAPNARGVRVIGDFNHWDARRPPDALARRRRGVGAVRARGRRRHPLQVRDLRAGRAVAGARPTRWRAWPSSRPPPRRWCTPSSRTSGATPSGCARRASSEPLAAADERVRGAPGFLAARAVLPRAGRGAGRLRDRRWVSPTWSSCRWPSTRSAAPGATRSPPTTRRRPGSAPRTTSATWWTGCTRPGSGSSSTGCPRTSRATTGRWPASTAPPLYEHADPRRGEHPDWGTLIFDFGRDEVRNFLVANALCWLEEFHVGRPAGGRGRLHALPGLLARAGRSGRRTRAAAGRTSTRSSFLQEVNATCYKPGARAS